MAPTDFHNKPNSTGPKVHSKAGQPIPKQKDSVQPPRISPPFKEPAKPAISPHSFVSRGQCETGPSAFFQTTPAALLGSACTLPEAGLQTDHMAGAPEHVCWKAQEPEVG